MLKDDLKKRKEHEAIRNSVGWYIFTHKLVEVAGSDSQTFLDMIYPNAIRKAKVGDAKYTTMLNEDGIVIDDVIIFSTFNKAISNFFSIFYTFEFFVTFYGTNIHRAIAIYRLTN